MSPRPAGARRVLPRSPFAPPVVEHVDYEVGDWVNSDRYGLGRVIGIEPGEVRASAVVVKHSGGNVLRFTLPSTSLHKLDAEGDVEGDVEA